MPGLVSVVVRRTQYFFPQNMQNSVNVAGDSAKPCTVLHMQAPYVLLLLYDSFLCAFLLQKVDKEESEPTQINLPSTFKSPCTRFGPASGPTRSHSVPLMSNRSVSPDYTTQLGNYVIQCHSWLRDEHLRLAM